LSISICIIVQTDEICIFCLQQTITLSLERLLFGEFLTVRSWHKVTSSQSTTKQAFTVGGIYHITIRLSLEPDRPYLGLTGRWRFYVKAVSSACWNVCFRTFLGGANDTELTFDCRKSGRSALCSVSCHSRQPFMFFSTWKRCLVSKDAALQPC
jgi:hypothetical protein